MRSTWIALGITLGIASCTTDSQPQLPQVSDLQQGVNILDAQAGRGVVAAYREGDNVVYLETRIGKLKPAVYRQEDPNEPANEVDMMIVDKHGIPFYVQRGGDEYVDPTWNAKIAIAKSTKLAADEDRNADFALAQKLGQQFERVADPSLADSTFHIHNMGAQPTPLQDPGLIAAAAKIQQTPLPSSDQAYWNGAGWWYPLGRLYSKCIFLCAAHHSAVSNWQWPNGGSAYQIVENYCNHGTCAGSMSWECDHYSDWRYNPSSTGEYSGSTGTVSGGCVTGYDWWGGYNTHLCNDDSAYELMEIKEGTTSTSWGDSYSFNWGNYSCYVGRGKWASPGCGE